MNAEPRHTPAEHLLVKKEQGGERLIPRGGGDVALGGKMVEKGARLRLVQRKVLTPNDFSCLAEVEDRLLRFQQYYESMATPFDWRLTRDDLAKLMKKFVAQSFPLPLAA